MAGDSAGIECIADDRGRKQLSDGDYPGFTAGRQFADLAYSSYEIRDSAYQGFDVAVAFPEQFRTAGEEVGGQGEMPFPELG